MQEAAVINVRLHQLAPRDCPAAVPGVPHCMPAVMKHLQSVQQRTWSRCPPWKAPQEVGSRLVCHFGHNIVITTLCRFGSRLCAMARRPQVADHRAAARQATCSRRRQRWPADRIGGAADARPVRAVCAWFILHHFIKCPEARSS